MSVFVVYVCVSSHLFLCVLAVFVAGLSLPRVVRAIEDIFNNVKTEKSISEMNESCRHPVVRVR